MKIETQTQAQYTDPGLLTSINSGVVIVGGHCNKHQRISVQEAEISIKVGVLRFRLPENSFYTKNKFWSDWFDGSSGWSETSYCDPDLEALEKAAKKLPRGTSLIIVDLQSPKKYGSLFEHEDLLEQIYDAVGPCVCYLNGERCRTYPELYDSRTSHPDLSNIPDVLEKILENKIIEVGENEGISEKAPYV